MPLRHATAVLTSLGWGANAPHAMASADTVEPADAHPARTQDADVQPVSSSELNAWRRGFTPQAEIWNGRLAMLGLSVGLTVLLIARLASR